MSYKSEFSWTTKNKKKIYAKDWQLPEKIESKAVICLIHGFGEHLNRYNHMATYFNKKGYAMMSFDHIGHGKSEGKRGHLPSFNTHMENVAELLKEAEKRYPLLPKFIYGHSMGGNIAMNYVLRNAPKIAGVITSGAWVILSTPPKPILVSIGKIMRKIAPSFLQSSDLDPSLVSSDEEEVEKYINDPLVHGKVSFNAGITMLEAADWLETYEGETTIPVFLMHGSDDKVIDPRSSQILYENLKGDITYESWEGFYHELHNEPGQQEVFDLTHHWMENKIQVWGGRDLE